MLAWVCTQCGSEQNARCKPKQCPECGATAFGKKEAAAKPEAAATKEAPKKSQRAGCGGTGSATKR